jgi:predicted negative regulator of RcsB-dependent stress response
MLSNSIANILVTILVFGFCCLVYFGYNAWQESEETAYESCIASVFTEIHKSEATKDLNKFPRSKLTRF